MFKYRFFIAAVYIFTSLLNLRSEDFPYDITLKDKVDFPIISEGKQVGVITATNGTPVLAVSRTSDQLEVRFKSYTANISKDKTDFDEVLKKTALEEQQKRAQREQKEKAAHDNAIAQQQLQKQESAAESYGSANRNIRILKKYIDSYPKEERAESRKLLGWNEDYVSKYSVASPEERLELYKQYNEQLSEFFNSRPIYAFKYNEMLHEDIVTPVEFGIYKNNDGLYISVGDGSFSTVADVAVDDLSKLIETSATLARWSKQCIEQSLDVEKELFRSRSMVVEFVSSDKADLQYLRVRVKGPFSKKSLLESQNVTMTKSNYMSLMVRISKAGQMAQERLNIQNNADKLR